MKERAGRTIEPAEVEGEELAAGERTALEAAELTVAAVTEEEAAEEAAAEEETAAEEGAAAEETAIGEETAAAEGIADEAAEAEAMIAEEVAEVELDDEEASLPIPQGILSPLGWVDSDSGVKLAPALAAMPKRVVHAWSPFEPIHIFYLDSKGFFFNEYKSYLWT